jgi:hypothetical protein
MLKLFAVMLGGRAEGCHIELHDVVFVIGNNLEEIYPQLVDKWFGIKKRLHIDASVELKYVDGHEIIISTEKPVNNNGKSLFFVNFGGYKKDYFGEIHDINFYVASSKTEALAKAKTELCKNFLEQHCDDNHFVDDLINTEHSLIDDIIPIATIDQYYIHLKETSKTSSLNIESYYRKLDVAAISQPASN